MAVYWLLSFVSATEQSAVSCQLLGVMVKTKLAEYSVPSGFTNQTA